MVSKLLNPMSTRPHGTLRGGIAIAICMSSTKVPFGVHFLEVINSD